MAKISKSERLLNLVAFLLKSRRPVTPGEIRRCVLGYEESAGTSAGAVERKFERDKATLREIGVPIKYVPEDHPGGPGYTIPRDAYFLPRIEFSPSEASLLAVAGRYALAGTAGPVSEALDSALRKLQFDSPIPGEARETAEEHFLFQASPAQSDPRMAARLRELTAAVLNRRAVRFTYHAMADDRTRRRIVEPYGLGFAEGHWYLVAYDRRRKGVRSFRVDRIQGEVKRVHPYATRPEYAVPDDFRIQDYLGVPPWLFGSKKKTTVRIRFDSDVAFMVRLRPAPGDEWEDAPDGGGTLTRRVTNPNALLPWTLGFGRHAVVLDPPEFRSLVIERLREIAARHAGDHAVGKDRDG